MAPGSRGCPVHPRVRHGPEKENRYTEKPRWNAGDCTIRELSKTDILSWRPGQVTGRWSSRLSSILSNDLHLAVHPRFYSLSRKTRTKKDNAVAELSAIGSLAGQNVRKISRE